MCNAHVVADVIGIYSGKIWSFGVCVSLRLPDTLSLPSPCTQLAATGLRAQDSRCNSLQNLYSHFFRNESGFEEYNLTRYLNLGHVQQHLHNLANKASLMFTRQNYNYLCLMTCFELKKFYLDFETFTNNNLKTIVQIN